VKASSLSDRPETCFDVSIQNHSPEAVHDIAWKVAQFQRKVIAAGCRRSECRYFLDHVSEFPNNGPLDFGLANNPYSTSVYVPSLGWDQPPPNRAPTSLPTARSTLQIDITEQNGTTSLSELTIVSGFDEKRKLLEYTFQNSGEFPLRMFINVSRTPEFDGQFNSSLKQPLFLKGGEEKRVTVKTEHNVAIEPTTVLVWNDNNELMGIGVASVYGMVGGTKELEGPDMRMLYREKPLKR
jgi:hypothetical protein